MLTKNFSWGTSIKNKCEYLVNWTHSLKRYEFPLKCVGHRPLRHTNLLSLTRKIEFDSNYRFCLFIWNKWSDKQNLSSAVAQFIAIAQIYLLNFWWFTSYAIMENHQVFCWNFKYIHYLEMNTTNWQSGFILSSLVYYSKLKRAIY